MRMRLLTALAALTTATTMGLVAPVQAAAPPAPPGLWVGSAGANRVTWAWTAVPGATSYRVAYSYSKVMDSPKFKTVSGRVLTLTGMAPGTRKYVAVRAITAAGVTAPSVIVVGVAGAVPKPSGGPKPDYDFCDWRWNRYAGAVKYLVQQSTSPTFKANVISKVVTGRTVELPVERDSYGYLRVKPLNEAGQKISSLWSLIGSCYVPYHPV